MVFLLLSAGSDALALEKISIEQLSRLGEVSKMKLGIQASGAASSASTTEHMCKLQSSEMKCKL